MGEHKYIFVVSRKVFELYSKILKLDKDKCLILKDGESQKNFSNFNKILEFMLKNKLSRKDYAIALGGGVIGDITGFAASCYKRGLNFIQIPTTLLADTDSSVGGKTAINCKYGKNLIGAFYQPKAVFINVNFLKTLSVEQFYSGMGEVLKYAFIEATCTQEVHETGLINFLTNNYEQIKKRDMLLLTQLIKRCVEIKAGIVEKDEKESGLRKVLNYGHTYAHALETITHYKKYTHGACVVEGMFFAMALGLKLGMIDKEYKYLCEDLIEKYDYARLAKFNIKKMTSIMASDKKNDGNDLTFILPNGYASVTEYKISSDELLKITEQGGLSGFTQ